MTTHTRSAVLRASQVSRQLADPVTNVLNGLAMTVLPGRLAITLRSAGIRLLCPAKGHAVE